jgi:3-hydroxyisobutyrate dehydrogenase
VRGVYQGQGGILDAARPGTLFIDCSTIDVATARAVIAEAGERGQKMVDSPMSGGVGGATAGTLTFMVGGSDEAFAAAQPVLQAMGKNIFHAGAAGAGCAAKICNNMMLAIQMIAVSEGFNLAEKLGLEAQKLYEISSTATARCWSLNDYCPAPGPVPTSPANRDYQPGFAAALMLKDLRIAMEAAQAAGAHTPMGAQATQIYGLMDLAGQSGRDFSGVIRLLRGEI